MESIMEEDLSCVSSVQLLILERLDADSILMASAIEAATATSCIWSTSLKSSERAPSNLCTRPTLSTKKPNKSKPSPLTHPRRDAEKPDEPEDSHHRRDNERGGSRERRPERRRRDYHPRERSPERRGHRDRYHHREEREPYQERRRDDYRRDKDRGYEARP